MKKRSKGVTRKSGARAAVLKGDGETVLEMVKGRARQGEWALRQAAQRGEVKIVRELLKAGVREGLEECLVLASSGHHTIAHRAENLEVVRALIKAGADVEARGGWAGDTPMLAAARGGFLEIVEELVKQGATVDFFAMAALGDAKRVRKCLAKDAGLAVARSGAGLLALHYCAASQMGRNGEKYAKGLAEVAEVLLEKGAPVNGVDEEGEAKHAWPRMGALAYACIVDNRAVADVLLARGADVNQRGNWGTPLMQACKHSEAIAARLVERGAEVDAVVDEDGGTALHVMANFPHPRAVKWLIAHGADVNVRRADGKRPLHRAAERNAGPKVCEMLVAAGAEVNARDGAGMTALGYALAKGKEKVAAYLRSVGGR